MSHLASPLLKRWALWQQLVRNKFNGSQNAAKNGFAAFLFCMYFSNENSYLRDIIKLLFKFCFFEMNNN